MAGRGAWPFHYQFGLDRRNDPGGRDAHGIYALKRELIFGGYAEGIDPDLPYWGKAVDSQTRRFQERNELVVDGQLGPKTAARLFRKRSVALERRYGIPNSFLCKLKTAESDNDPVAEGRVDPDDEGIVQINLDYHPSVAAEQAWSPSFALSWAAVYLFDSMNYTSDVEAAVVSYNIGRYRAKQWVEAGKPDEGGPLIGGQDGWTRATAYLSLVKAASC